MKRWKKPLEILFTQVYHKWQSYDIWFLRYQVQQTDFFAIFGNFFPFTQKMEISKKWKKYLEITSFYKSAPKLMIIGYSVPEIWHMMDVIVSFHFGLFFCPFTPLKPKKWKYQKIKKKYLKITSFYLSVPKIMIICYTVPEIWCVPDVIVIFLFELFFILSPP